MNDNDAESALPPCPRCRTGHVVRNGTTRALFAALPEDYRRDAIFLTDFWPTYRAALPDGRHGECAKGDGLTNHVERFWCTLRQRCARFVRKSLSFS